MKISSAILLFIACVTPCFIAHAQNPSTPAFFTTDEINGCAPFTVTITAPSCSPCAILHDINDPSSTGKSIVGTDATPDTLIYTKPGIYTMVIVSGTLNYTITITVLQNFSPTFDVYACNNNNVYLKITDTRYNGGYTVDYPAGQTMAVSSGASYTLTLPPGTAQPVKVRGKYNLGADNCLVNTQTVDVQNVITVPSFSKLTAISGSQINLDLNQQQSVLYKLEIAVNNASGFQQLQNVVNTGTVSLTNNVKPDDNFYCFRMAAIDRCINTTGAYSPSICSLNFDAVAKNNQNDLAWLTSTVGITSYTLTRNSAPLLPNPATTDVSKIDNTAICNTDYTYQLTSNYSSAQSISLPKTVTAFSTDVPPSINNITAAVRSDGASVDLSWPAGTLAKSYSILRSPAPSLIGTSATPQFSDDAYANQSNFCYQVKYDNTCNNSSLASTEACPVHLSGSVQKDNAIVLTWTPYTGWANGVASYTLEKYTTSGQLIQSFIMGTSTTFTDDVQDLTTQSYVYFVNAYANDAGLGTAVSNTVTMIKQPNLFYPSAFTPNSDSLNDQFKVFGQFISAFEMEIFNRWGEPMFTTDNLTEGWDGTYKGIPMPEGTYAFVAKITDSIGRTFKQSGSIVLLRKK